MKLSEIRFKFLNFFRSNNHKIFSSSSLIPKKDKTLIFTNSGMVQFKKFFIEKRKIIYDNSVSSQRCVRISGKHNDFENIGYKHYHNTFFEMLGNFSFGYYFKYEAIKNSWEILTNLYKFKKQKIYVTVHCKDMETYNIWYKNIGLRRNQIKKIYNKNKNLYSSENFWQMSDIGPCGPSTEIFYNYTSKMNNINRYIEIWNIVFMQFNRDSNDNINILPKKCIDTGMGIERLYSIIQDVNSVYDTNFFKKLIKSVANLININNLKHNSLKVISDHLRSSIFLILDGLIPNNYGKAYALRKIIRRAMRHAYKLGFKKPFLYKLIFKLPKEMYFINNKLNNNIKHISNVLLKEENIFHKTIENGILILKNSLKNISKGTKLSGKKSFLLYDTYGFPLDLIRDVCRRKNIRISKKEFNVSMSIQRNKSKKFNNFKYEECNLYFEKHNYFCGYIKNNNVNSIVKEIYINNVKKTFIKKGDLATIIVNITPFYYESGGQNGDVGLLKNQKVKFYVQKTIKLKSFTFGHYGKLTKGNLFIGEYLKNEIDYSKRSEIQNNHSALHLLNYYLKKNICNDIKQCGSEINSRKIRFDFSYDIKISSDKIIKTEENINQDIFFNYLTKIKYLNEKIIKNKNINNKKTKKKLRLVTIGYSNEFCIGTHVYRTGEIGLLKIVSENSISNNIRRIEAITNYNLLNFIQSQSYIVSSLIKQTNKLPYDLSNYLFRLQNKINSLESNICKLNSEILNNFLCNVMNKSIFFSKLNLISHKFEFIESRDLLLMVNNIKKISKKSISLIFITRNKKIDFICSVTNKISILLKSNNFVKFISFYNTGSGGGNKYISMGSIFYKNFCLKQISKIINKYLVKLF